ncbi:SH3 domain-containing protein, partial [Rhizobiaceae sp. 2RAB30]
MRRLGLLVITATLTASTALADPAVTTSKVNLREGPGTNYKSLGTVPDETQVDLGDCDDAGAWCTVTYQGKNGFVAGRYLDTQQTDTAKPGWPRTYTTDKGAEMVLYQPQITDWPNFTEVNALVAAEYKKDKDAKAVFGVIGISGKTVADKESGDVVISDIKTTELNFSALDRTQLGDLALEVGKVLPVP